MVLSAVRSDMYAERYADVFNGTENWRDMAVKEGSLYNWDETSTYVRLPPFFTGEKPNADGPLNVSGARPLAILGDSVTTDHISPAGAIKETSPAGSYLKDKGIGRVDFNSYGARRGNHEVMMRGTFANIRIKNKMVPGIEGGVTKHYPSAEEMSIYDASQKYIEEGTPLVVFGGREYGTGSSRDWAAKGTKLLGVKAVIAESFERIHRTNLVCMGVLPLQMPQGQTVESLGLTGDETFDLKAQSDEITPGQDYVLTVTRASGETVDVNLTTRIDTENEVDYFKADGILPFVLDQLAS